MSSGLNRAIREKQKKLEADHSLPASRTRKVELITTKKSKPILLVIVQSRGFLKDMGGSKENNRKFRDGEEQAGRRRI